ncbi:MAG TPA: hypothetical protein VE549_01725 [Myxococcaceae bacterium]|nr:hypothetical protein [Myxococcaceae bacterium]
MSIVRSLIWLFDRNEEREKDAEHKQWMQQFATPDPDDGPTPPGVALEPKPRAARCRVCGLEELEKSYCSSCLADTLIPIER